MSKQHYPMPLYRQLFGVLACKCLPRCLDEAWYLIKSICTSEKFRRGVTLNIENPAVAGEVSSTVPTMKGTAMDAVQCSGSKMQMICRTNIVLARVLYPSVWDTDLLCKDDSAGYLHSDPTQSESASQYRLEEQTKIYKCSKLQGSRHERRATNGRDTPRTMKRRITAIA